MATIGAPLLDVRLHAALEARVGVDDVPLARRKRSSARNSVRVDDVLGLLLGGLGGGEHLVLGVDVEGVVDHGVGLGIGGLGHGVQHGVEVDVVALVVDDVHRAVLGRFDRLLVVLERVALLGLVVIGGLLGCGGPVDVVALSLRHFVIPFPRSALGRPDVRAERPDRPRRSEDVQHEPAEDLVEAPHERHHDDEHEHHDREADQLLARRGDDLQFGDHLPDEQGDPREGVPTRGAVALRVGDDILTGFVDDLACHLYTFRGPAVTAGSQGGQDSNLQPAVLETAALPIELHRPMDARWEPSTGVSTAQAHYMLWGFSRKQAQKSLADSTTSPSVCDARGRVKPSGCRAAAPVEYERFTRSA